MDKKNFQIDYRYKNTTGKEIDVWFSKPIETSTQKNIEIVRNREPDTSTEYPFLNPICYYKLNPDDELKITIRYYGTSKEHSSSGMISEEESQFFLRSTRLIPVNESTKESALLIIDKEKDQMQKAKKIFKHIVTHFKYSTHFNERGIQSFLKKKKGDCGEFAALFASYCRSVGIPARVLYGTWTLKKFSPHSWAEVYIQGKGWVPVDPSMGRMKLFYHPFIHVTSAIFYGAMSNNDRYFGSHEGKRFAFSIEPFRDLSPVSNIDIEMNYFSQKACIDGEMIAWGYEFLDGKAPFLQPIYPRIHSPLKKTNVKLLFGSWRGKHLEWRKHLSYHIKTASFSIAFICLFIELINDYLIKNQTLSVILPSLSIPLVLLGILFSLFRREGNAAIYIMGFFFLLALVDPYLTR
ncbi:transglutaminase-like domain-containing protein [Bacillus sp. 1P06AnD]|uniref:transglutaminase-like domain-containing protein n=1 Tax=Bacillus sp. 1P06AnD TaxID=3132208 RepID=UPI0039A2824C